MKTKIFAKSINRYRASASEKRAYGGSTVTEFLVGVEGSNASTWKKIMGYGPTPGDRKSYAIQKSGFTETSLNYPMPITRKCIGDGHGICSPFLTFYEYEVAGIVVRQIKCNHHYNPLYYMDQEKRGTMKNHRIMTREEYEILQILKE
jgi:hypothetical protein